MKVFAKDYSQNLSNHFLDIVLNNGKAIGTEYHKILGDEVQRVFGKDIVF